ncbi:hypothetical protein EDB84DRAFT_1560393 [Lactarius hengduanensis]|nr:hypothetical protein EDB84DRAFT_1560393 [Lactarius hengduanensis]
MAELSNSPTASPDVIRVAGPLLFGRLFNWTLYGVLCVQIYVYSYNFPKDPRPAKFLAYFVFVLEAVQTVLTGAHHDCSYFAHRARILLLSDLGTNEQKVVDLLDYRCLTQAAAEIWLSITSLVAEKYVVSKTALYVRILVSVEPAATGTPPHVVVLVMVYTECYRGHSDCGGNDVAAEKGERRILQLRIGSRGKTYRRDKHTNCAALTTLVLYVAFPNGLYYAYTHSNTLLVSLNNRIYFREHNHPDMAIALSSRSPTGFAPPHYHRLVSPYLSHSYEHQQVEFPVTAAIIHIPTSLNGSVLQECGSVLPLPDNAGPRTSQDTSV